MSPLLEIALATHPGRVRSQNEDCIAADEHAAFAVLADGMGGHNAGEVASRMAVDVVSSCLQRAAPTTAAAAEVLIAQQIAAANAAIFETGRADLECFGMGTTLVVAAWHEDGVSFGHVGDSRLYLLRHGRLEQLTRDHSLVQLQVDAGAISPEEARRAAHRSIIMRAVGTDAEVEADIDTCRALKDDLYLLCSDGLTDMVTDEEIRKTLLSCGMHSRIATRRLVDVANDNGGLDNISVILVRVVHPGEE